MQKKKKKKRVLVGEGKRGVGPWIKLWAFPTVPPPVFEGGVHRYAFQSDKQASYLIKTSKTA